MTITVTGTEQVSREIHKRNRAAFEELKVLVRNASEPILAEARRLCISSRVRKALVMVDAFNDKGEVVQIGPDLSITKIAHFIEFGTSAHTQQSWNRRGTIQHPGTTARPFLRPAFDNQKDKVEKAIGKGLSVAMGLD